MNDTPLTLAACYGNSDQTGEAIINLINAGADVRVKNIKEKTALGCAVSNKHVPLNVIEVLEGHIKE